jgi:hypothetical protein
MSGVPSVLTGTWDHDGHHWLATDHHDDDDHAPPGTADHHGDLDHGSSGPSDRHGDQHE